MTNKESLRSCTLDELHVDDEASMKAVPVYADLKTVLLRAGHRFRVLPAGSVRWDRALLLNLTFWGGDGGDVLPEDRIAADVVAHVAWHHLAARALPPADGGLALSVDALFLGEAIASAFDVYLVGRLLGTQRKRSPRSSFLETQVPAMAESASAAGLDERAFEALLGTIAAAPERSFEQLRSLLVDVASGLHGCVDAADGLAVLQAHEDHPFAPLLHRYELSNWVLWARAWAPDRCAPDEAARAVDASLRAAPDALAWLTTTWLRPLVA
ncbi:MAG: hypothetical protein Q8O67_27675 [Deltaproteobacteria bacterium]|nr:hypothetical protein [Deltaproteobacteria bacterium]